MSVTAIDGPQWAPILRMIPGLVVVAIEAIDFFRDVQRRRNRVRRPREDGHHRIADRLHDGAGMLLNGRVEQREMLADQRIGVEIAEPLIHGGRALEVGEQEGDLPDAEALPLVDTLGAEEAPEGLPREQRSAGNVWVEIERRLDRHRHNLGRPVDQEQRAARGVRCSRPR